MSNGKGKERAASLGEAETSHDGKNPTDNSTGLLGRVATSAAGLARSSFKPPNSEELGGHASRVSNNAGKGESSSQAGNSSSDGNSQSQPLLPATTQYQASSTLRTQTEEHVLRAESEFSSFLDESNTFMSADNEEPGAELQDSTAQNAPVDEQHIPQDFDLKGEPKISVAEQEAADGMDVVAFLSQPATMEEIDDLPEVDDTVSWNLTEEQISMLKLLMKNFPLPEIHKTPRADDSLNLVPWTTETPGLTSGGSTKDSVANDTWMYFGETLDPAEAREVWLSQWNNVLTSYTEEVWGDLFPIVEQAQQELEDIKGSSAVRLDRQPKALRRLGIILGHGKVKMFNFLV